MSKEDTIKCFLDCKGEDDSFSLTLNNETIDVIANEIERLNNAIKEVREYIENERNKMKNHQYAVGIRRLNKIEKILDKENI